MGQVYVDASNSHRCSNVYDTSLTKPISADVEACATVGPGQWRVLQLKPSRKRSLWLLGKGTTIWLNSVLWLKLMIGFDTNADSKLRTHLTKQDSKELRVGKERVSCISLKTIMSKTTIIIM